jgi:addiction module RelE/StbE family toxin
MYQVKVTKPAERDLQDAVSYITDELKNSQAAADLLDLAEEAMKSLAEFPMRHAPIEIDELAQEGIRYLSVRHYLLFYTVKEKQQTVSVIRFLYGRRDWNSLLNNEGK